MLSPPRFPRPLPSALIGPLRDRAGDGGGEGTDCCGWAAPKRRGAIGGGMDGVWVCGFMPVLTARSLLGGGRGIGRGQCFGPGWAGPALGARSCAPFCMRRRTRALWMGDQGSVKDCGCRTEEAVRWLQALRQEAVPKTWGPGRTDSLRVREETTAAHPCATTNHC